MSSLGKRPQGQKPAFEPLKGNKSWWKGARAQREQEGEGVERLALEKDLERIAAQVSPDVRWAPGTAWVVSLGTLRRYVRTADALLAACTDRPQAAALQMPPQPAVGTSKATPIEVD